MNSQHAATAAQLQVIVMPVSENDIRTAFEVWVNSSPYEESAERYPNDPTKYGWPGNYKDIRVDMCWQAWKSACEMIQGAIEA